jgi:hypothetical protein
MVSTRLLGKLKFLFPKSLIAEFHDVFGDETTAKLLTIFAGTIIRVPSSRDITRSEQAISIYETFEGVTPQSRVALANLVCSRWKLNSKRVMAIFRKMQSVAKDAARLQESNSAVSKLKKGRGHHETRRGKGKGPRF